MISAHETRDISATYSVVTYMSSPTKPLDQFLVDISGFESPGQLKQILNSIRPFDSVKLQDSATNEHIQQLFDNLHRSVFTVSTTDASHYDTEYILDNAIGQFSNIATDNEAVCNDAELKKSINSAVTRAIQLR